MDDKTRLSLYRQTIMEYRQWLSEFPEICHVLDSLSATVEGGVYLNSGTPHGTEFCTVQGLREQIRRMKQ